MAFSIDISVLGSDELQKKLDTLTNVAARKVVKDALRNSAGRLKQDIIENVSGLKLGVITGAYRKAWEAANVVMGMARRGIIRLGIPWPTREELGISAEDPNFFPVAIEYGHRIVSRNPSRTALIRQRRVAQGFTPDVRPYPHLRPAVDEHKAIEYAAIARDIGDGIQRAWDGE